MGDQGESVRAKPTLVIVDDSDEVRFLVRTRLELSGQFEVVGEGRDGSEAIGLAYRHQPALMLLDTSMPAMDGLEALPAVLALSPETRVVIFTGFEERGLADRAREFGAADFIEKSLPIHELPDRLASVLPDHVPDPPQRGHGLRLVGSASLAPDAQTEADQEVLDEHLERFREVFDQAAIGMATLTLRGSIVRANAALAGMMQCQPSDLVGVDYGVLTRGQGDSLDDALTAIADEGRDMVSFEHPLPVGEDPGSVRATLAPVRDSKGQPLYIFAQVQDISAQRFAEEELRLSEERFRLLVTAVSEYAIFMLDPTGTVVSWNAGAQRIKGYTAEQIVGRSFRVFYPPEEQDSGHPEHNLELAIERGSYAEEGWRVRQDGSTFWASVVITALYNDVGEHIGFAKVTRDQTEQRAVEEQRREAIEQQAHLLAVTAHELRTPSAVIDGSVTLLETRWDELDDAQRQRLLNAISASSRRLHRLVSDLGTASRLHADSLTLEPEDVSLEAALTSAVERTRAANTAVQVEVEVPQDRVFVADPARLGQALDNLLDNAVRHGQQPIRVEGSLTPDGVRIVTSDAGSGVGPDLVPRLFERFATGSRGGTGLGLYLVREIARRHGGDATYHPRRGAERPSFVLELPAEPGEASAV